MKYVYHGSSQAGLKELKPHVSTHLKEWIYAAPDKVFAAIFLNKKGGDFVLKVGRDSGGTPYISERFNGAFKVAYQGGGSLYTLDGANFHYDKTQWPEEVISEKPVKVIAEEVIENTWQYLLGLEKMGKLRISYFPEKYMCPPDDKDIIDKAVLWSQQNGGNVLELFKEYHPKLYPKAIEKLRK